MSRKRKYEYIGKSIQLTKSKQVSQKRGQPNQSKSVKEGEELVVFDLEKSKEKNFFKIFEN